MKSSCASYDYKGKLTPSAVMKLKACPMKPAYYAIFTNSDDSNGNDNNPEPINYKPKTHNTVKMEESNEQRVLARTLIKPAYGVTLLLPQKTIRGVRYTDNPLYTNLSVSNYNELCGYKKISTPLSKHSSKELNIEITPKASVTEASIKSSKETSFKPTEIFIRSGKCNTRNKLIHNGYVHTGTWDCLNDDKPLVRKAINVPDKKRCVSVLRRSQNCFVYLRNSRKLPPPPLGLTLGHGLFKGK